MGISLTPMQCRCLGHPPQEGAQTLDICSYEYRIFDFLARQSPQQPGYEQR
jgi:hypothetical protein